MGFSYENTYFLLNLYNYNKNSVFYVQNNIEIYMQLQSNADIAATEMSLYAITAV